MAAAAASMSSSFSTSVQTLKGIRSKAYSSDHLLKITLYRPILHLTGLTSQFVAIESPSRVSQRWRLGRIIAAVELEGAVTDTVLADEEASVTEEEEEEGQKLSSEEGESSRRGVNTKLYFGNLPYNCDSAQLAGIIQDYASPELIEVLYDRGTGRSRGFAFVIMSSIEECNAVIENLDGCQYGGRTLRVNFSDKPKAKEPLYPETEHKLFVGNLSWTVTSEILTKVFEEQSDNVVGARVLYDGETGRSRGYGFVSYSTKSDMDTALVSMDGMELEGRAIRVSLAEGKKR